MGQAERCEHNRYPGACPHCGTIPAAPPTPGTRLPEGACPHGSYRHVCDECLSVTVAAPMVEQGETPETEVPAVIDLSNYKVESITGGVKVQHFPSGILATAWHHTSNGALWKAIGAIYGRIALRSKATATEE